MRVKNDLDFIDKVVVFDVDEEREGLHVINATLYSGAALIIHDHFDPHIFLKTIENHNTEQLFLVPPLINFLANSPLTEQFNLSSVRHIFNAAAPILEEDSRLLTKKFNIKIIQGYGLTETGIIVTTSGNESYPKSQLLESLTRDPAKLQWVSLLRKRVPGFQKKIFVIIYRNLFALKSGYMEEFDLLVQYRRIAMGKYYAKNYEKYLNSF
ncbi:AMP-binding domain containing protein, partial [Asbolus verrucosus]